MFVIADNLLFIFFCPFFFSLLVHMCEQLSGGKIIIVVLKLFYFCLKHYYFDTITILYYIIILSYYFLLLLLLLTLILFIYYNYYKFVIFLGYVISYYSVCTYMYTVHKHGIFPIKDIILINGT